MTTHVIGTTRKPTREQANAIAAHRLAVRRARPSRLRRAVITLAVLAFALPWAGIYEQLAAGRDPALAKDDVPAASNATKSAHADAAAIAAAKARAARRATRLAQRHAALVATTAPTQTTAQPAPVTTQQS